MNNIESVGRSIPDRIRQRLIVQAIAKIAENRHADRITIEDMYSKGRTAIIHLHVDDLFPVENRRTIEAKLDDLLRTTDKFLAAARGVYSDRWLNELQRLASRLRPAWERDKSESKDINQVNLNDILVMIDVVNEIVHQHVAAGYETVSVIDSKAFLLAHMVAENFTAYDLTLNTSFLY